MIEPHVCGVRGCELTYQKACPMHYWYLRWSGADKTAREAHQGRARVLRQLKETRTETARLEERVQDLEFDRECYAQMAEKARQECEAQRRRAEALEYRLATEPRDQRA